MLRLLLDEHVSPKIAEQLLNRQLALSVVAAVQWDGGAHLGSTDLEMLTLAYQQSLTVVTYDLKTISPLLKAMAEQRVSHGGVIFVDTKTYFPSDIGGLVSMLESVWLKFGHEDWQDRVMYAAR